jgi:hypothetical protein
MDRLIRTAWRAFWVGLGASAVLISQSVLTPSPSTPGPSTSEPTTAPLVAPAPALAPAAAKKGKNADPILSRNPFDSKTRLVPRG